MILILYEMKYQNMREQSLHKINYKIFFLVNQFIHWYNIQ